MAWQHVRTSALVVALLTSAALAGRGNKDNPTYDPKNDPKAGSGGASADAPKVAPKLIAGSTWRGTLTADVRRANQKPTKANLHVDKRDGKTIEGTFNSRGGSMPFKGEIADDGTFTLTPGVDTKKNAPEIYAGKVDGDHLTFHIRRSSGDANSQGPDVDLTLVEKKNNKDG